MPPRSFRPFLALGALVVLAGCSSTGGAGSAQPTAAGPARDAQPVFAQAVSETRAARTFRYELTTKVTADQTTIEGSSSGAIDLDAQRASFSGEVQVSGPLRPDLGTVEVVVADGDVYVQSDRLAEVSALTTPWVRIADADGGLVSGEGDQASLLPGRPEPLLDLLEGAGGQVSELGRTTLDGVAVRHLRADVDLADAAASTEGAGLPGVDPTSLTGPVVVELWVDDDDLIRQLHLTASPTAGERGATIDTTLRVLDPGSPVTIDVPPADEVTDLDLADLFSR